MNELFKCKSLSKKCEQEYNNRYFPNCKLLNRDEYSEEFNLKTVKYNDLENHDFMGMLYSMTRNEDGDLMATFEENAHTLVIGTTQVGKTWGHVMDSVYALSAKKNKPDFMLSDPKGEISENTAEILQKRGYKIFALNFKDPRYSHMWNPLREIYDSWMEMNDVEDDLKYHGTLTDLSSYTPEAPISAFQEGGFFWSFDGSAYPTTEDAYLALTHKQGDIKTQISDLINQLVDSLGAEAVQKSKEPCWQLGGLEILRGMIFLMLEDALDKRSGFEKEHMNFMNMQHYYELIREEVLSGSINTPLLNTIKLSHKKSSDESIRHMRAYFENAPTTSRSYMGCFDNIMQSWFNPKIYAIANDNSIDLDNPDDQPLALFLITRDYEKSDYFIAGMFVDWVYMKTLTKAEKNGGKLNREMFFILDEFANIPIINNFAGKISTSLSRRMIFQLYIQSYEQLESNYGSSDAGTIRANCNVEIFLGSQSYKTKHEFSEKCGKMRIKGLDSVLSPDRHTIIEIPVLSLNSLEALKQGDAYVKRLNRPVSKSHFEMAFKCEEFSHNKVSTKDLGIKATPYNDDIYVYKYLENEKPMRYQTKPAPTERVKTTFIDDF